MGNFLEKPQEPPPMVLVPPLFERPYLTTRSRMAESSFDFLFSKVARKHLFMDYFDHVGQLMGQIMLQPADDPRVAITAVVKTSLEHAETTGECTFRWQRDLLDPNTFVDFTVSSVDNAFKLRACTFSEKTGIGAFALLPVTLQNREKVNDSGHVGIRYSSEKFTAGLTGSPYHLVMQGRTVPTSLWVAGRLGQITAGVEYKPSFLDKQKWGDWRNLEHWRFALDYGTATKGPLQPSFNFCIEFFNNSKLVASYFHHLVVQRRVKNPFEAKEVVGITNYVDLGFELEHRLVSEAPEKVQSKSTLSNLHLVASWQANKNIMLKGKVGSLNSGLAVIFKSWWQPSFTFSCTVAREHLKGVTNFGFGIRVENFGGVSYERADPNYVILTPSKQHIAEGLLRETGKRPLLQSDVVSGNMDALPPELKPMDKIL